jgi:plastocyanin
MNYKTHLILSAALLAFPLPAVLANSVTYLLTIKDHQFNPAELKIPAGQKIKLTVHNLDSTPEEFESYELNREKIIPGGQSTSIYIGPLEAGRYPFFGEFHQDTAQGVIVTE